MFWIHLLIILIFCLLFFLSLRIRAEGIEKASAVMKPFLKISGFLFRYFPVQMTEDSRKKLSLLNPAGGTRSEIRRHFCGKLAEALCIFFAGNLLGLLLTFSSLREAGELESNVLKRNSYGEGEKQVSLDAEIGGEPLPGGLDLSVSERRYSEEEIRGIFDEIAAALPDEILGENESPDHVEHNLTLCSSFGDYPVGISWEISDYDVMDGEGQIREEVTDKKGSLITLTAVMDYYDAHAEYEFPLRVFPAKQTGPDEVRSAILKKISRYDKATVSGEALILPPDLAGASITYRKREGHAGLLFLLLSAIGAFVVYCGRDRELDRKLRERERSMMLAYPELVSRLSLLFAAGMTLRGAFEKIAWDYEKRSRAGLAEKSFAYEEMLLTVREMQGGTSEFQAYQNFGKRSGVRRYNKLGTLLAQNLQKGSSGLLQILESESKEAFEERKALARRLGEEAGTKLLLPMGIMLLIVMVIVIVPAFLSFSL